VATKVFGEGAGTLQMAETPTLKALQLPSVECLYSGQSPANLHLPHMRQLGDGSKRTLYPYSV
ncbi:3-oxoacyl-acp synthase, partial [Lasius niger]